MNRPDDALLLKGLLRRLLEVLLKVPGLLGLVLGLRLPEGVKNGSSRSLFPIPQKAGKSRESNSPLVAIASQGDYLTLDQFQQPVPHGKQ